LFPHRKNENILPFVEQIITPPLILKNAPETKGKLKIENARLVSCFISEGEIYMRLQNSSGGKATAKISGSMINGNAYIFDLFLREKSIIPFKRNCLTLGMKPYEIITVKLDY